jgi:hypothetical protein
MRTEQAMREKLKGHGNGIASKFCKIIIDLQNFKQLNQPFKGPI